MQRDPGPRNALHIGHRSAAVDVRCVPSGLRNDCEDAGRCRMRWHSGGNRRPRDETILAIDRNLLAGDSNNDLERALIARFHALRLLFTADDFAARLSMWFERFRLVPI